MIEGSISLSDIEQVLSVRGGFKRLFQNAQQFFSSLRLGQGLERGGNDRVPLVRGDLTVFIVVCDSSKHDAY